MERILDKDVTYEMLLVVKEIIEGCAFTYGQILNLIAKDMNARWLVSGW